MAQVLSLIVRFRLALLALTLGVFSSVASAQTCGPNATAVRFNFGTPAQVGTSATGGTATWTTSSLGPTGKPLGTVAAGTANTLTFSMNKSANAVWTSDTGATGSGTQSPMQFTTGNMANSLLLAMNNAANGDWTGMTITFARPMSTVSFTIGDVDTANDPWDNSTFQDRFEVTGYLSGVAVTAPVLTPNSPANYTTTTLSGITSQITRNTAAGTTGSCNNTQTACNVVVSFPQPIDAVRLRFISGPAFTAPTLQYVGFDDFSFCEPTGPDLKLTKAATTTTFVAGQTGTYTLVVTNVGGTATSGSYTVTDVISTTGLTFPSPLTPGGGWTCTVGTTTVASDTASCARSTALAVNGSATLTLTVAVSPGATTTPIVNRAKAWGGNDPNKTTLTSTGAVANCSAANEGLSGGGANAGCAYEATTLARQANLTVAKTNGVSSLLAGSTATYTLTFANIGPSNADGAIIKDTSTVGLNCSAAPATVTCTTLTGGAVCPTGLTLGSSTSSASVPNFFTATGITIPTFPVGGTVVLRLACRVTATGS